jgi:hypothetical protein
MLQKIPAHAVARSAEAIVVETSTLPIADKDHANECLTRAGMTAPIVPSAALPCALERA